MDESVHRFIEANSKNIRRSDKGQIASASYGRGMVDMIMLVRSAFGRWGIEQLLAELDRRKAKSGPGGHPTVRINITADKRDAITQEDVKELGQQIERWVMERKTTGKTQRTDPMFA